MRKVFLDELPKKKYGTEMQIDWRKCIGYKIKFIYDDIEGELEIIKVNKSKITTKYKKIVYDLSSYSLLHARISYCIGYQTNEYKYNIGDIVETKTGKIKILEQYRFNRKTKGMKYNSKEKTYKYECLKDGNIDTIKESELFRGGGCNVCYNRKVLKGVNDIDSTDKWITEYIVNKEDSYSYTRGSKVKILMKCPICGHQKLIQPYVMLQQGFGCNQCSDGLSYPSKIMTSVLNQLNLEYTTEYCADWSDNKKYDYFLSNENLLLEINGMQHYDGGFVRANGRTLEEEQKNDKLKKELALSNGIKEKNYIVVDCRYSELEWIKNNILKSRLAELFDLSKIDWLKCHEFALSSRVKEACELWNSGINNTEEIRLTMKVCRSTVIRWLNKGSKINWCKYSDNKGSGSAKKIKILEIDNMFESVNECFRYLKSLGLKLTITKIRESAKSHIEYKGYHFEYI